MDAWMRICRFLSQTDAETDDKQVKIGTDKGTDQVNMA